MPISKLTLSADRDLIKEAKKLAAEEGTSLSALFSRLFLPDHTCQGIEQELLRFRHWRK